MTPDATELRAAIAVLTMQRNRAEVRAILDPGGANGGTSATTFPRSATFRWLLTRVTGRSIASALTTFALARIPLGQIPLGRLIGRALFNRKH